MISNESRKELDARAREKNYSVMISFPPQRLAVMNRKTGKVAGFFLTVEEVGQFIDGLDVYTHVEIKAEPVGWTVDPQLAPPSPKKCSNGFGADCLCLTNTPDDAEDTLGPTVWCFLQNCDWPALCGGSCYGHYGYAKLFGDKTLIALARTDGMITTISKVCNHGPEGYHDYDSVKARWLSGRRQRIISLKQMNPTNGTSADRAANELAILSGLLGINIRPVGDGAFTVVDGSGNVLAYHTNRAELLEMFYGD